MLMVRLTQTNELRGSGLLMALGTKLNSTFNPFMVFLGEINDQAYSSVLQTTQCLLHEITSLLFGSDCFNQADDILH